MKKSDLMVLLLMISACAGLRAQETPPNAVPVTLGQSVVKLYGPWRFHIGDNPQWADPTYDDSQWESVDLRPTPQTAVPGIPFAGFVTGWQQRGHPGYAGFAWYRMRTRISAASGPLTLLGPAWFEGGYQVFANGRLVGSFGDFTRLPPELFYPNPASFSVPASDYEHTPDGTVLIALRFYTPAAALVVPAMGGMHVPPRIGLPSAAAAVFQVEWDTEYWRLVSALAAALVWTLFALLIAMLFAFSRADNILLWPLAACIFNAIFTGLVVSTNAQWLPHVRLDALINLAGTLGWYMWMLAWWAYFGLQKKRWLFKAIVTLGVIDLLDTQFFIFAKHAAGASHDLVIADPVISFAISASELLITATIAFLGWKNPIPRKWPLYLALMFYALTDLAPLMSLLHVRHNWLFFGMQVPFALLCVIGMLFFFSIVLFQQFRSSMQRQQAAEDDLKQAQEVQHLLIPRNAPNVPGWIIESEYRPARNVGGDFFQVLPGDDASLLIVVGDVSGKGLKAAMTVSAIVGALRGCALRGAADVLTYLNRVLHGQISGFATCAVASIAADGAMIVANAGHLSPYRNGKEMAVASGLPLGITADASFEETHFKLVPGDRLTFISDGVVEATNGKRELFGFERAEEISNQPAARIAEAAQQWGQDDDITVLTVACTA
ncbi:MAG: SpoIIE family protein phosphatase [Acidobacteriota bacterium]|nr:SpoIIE family protein phosphatase [Acidobacteriota bacterium]